MKKIILVFLLSCTILFGGCDFLIGKQLDVEPMESNLIEISQISSTQEVARVVGPAIVGISGYTKSGESVGSGVCVSDQGFVLTNSHVISGADKIVLYLSNKSSASAEVVYDNPVLDLAILKSSKSLPYLKLGSSDELNVGEDVLAVGTPLSLSLTHTFTKGIVSALDRTLKVSTYQGEGYMQNLIQHDASLNPGNSGGPLLNMYGEVVGINTLKIASGEGIGFAIPTKSFESLLESYVSNINYQIPYLGLYGYDSEIANYYNMSDLSDGFFVLSVSDDSPLKQCGVIPECVITEFNGKEIKNTLDLKDELYSLNSSDTVYVKFNFKGESYKIKTKLNKV